LDNFIKKDLKERGWKDKAIKDILGEPDNIVKNNYYGETYLYNKNRVLKAEKTIEFILSAYNKEMIKIINNSNVKKINKNDIKKFKLKVKDSRNQQKKNIIALFFKKMKMYHSNISSSLIFSFSLEEMLEILNNDSFKTALSIERINLDRYKGELVTLCEVHNKPYLEYEKILIENPTQETIDKIKNNFEEEKREKDKKFRAITKIEDIENFYKEARSIKREFKAYLGPTNSGKTYNAIQSLLKANTAIYLAPLRLLAREVYDLLKSNGIKVSLITGEEKIIDDEATHVCSTIEALDIRKKYDLAVIDEVQFLNDRQRGSSWTRAVYGVYADTVICLGSSNVENVLRKILNKTNENLEVSYLERKTSLNISDILYNVEDLEKGDAVIAFSRKKIYEHKKIIEENTNLSVGVIYGMMPPEIRIKTAERFNSGEIDIIVATDAIGIGLNLEIKRVVFTDLTKYNGNGFEFIQMDLFKQIAGRAGRYKKYDNGYVSICDDLCYNLDIGVWHDFANSLHSDNSIIEKIYFFPELEHLLKIADELNEYSDLKKIIETYESYFQDTTGLFKKNFSFVEENLELIYKLPLDLSDKYRLLFAPVSKSNEDFFVQLLDNLCMEKKVSFDDFEFKIRNDIKYMEEIIQDINIYRWMHFSFPDYFEIGELDDLYIKLLEVLDKEMILNTINRRMK